MLGETTAKFKFPPPAFVLQVYEPAPIAVSVLVCPLHAVLVPEMVMVGLGDKERVIDEELLQPPKLVTVTE